MHTEYIMLDNLKEKIVSILSGKPDETTSKADALKVTDSEYMKKTSEAAVETAKYAKDNWQNMKDIADNTMPIEDGETVDNF